MSLVKAALRLLLGTDRVRALEEQIEEGTAKYRVSRDKEETTMEVADWIGNTGLSEESERELPRYLRRESGELMEDEGALKAADLVYIGAFPEGSKSVHYWRVPTSDNNEIYAYIATYPNGDEEFGWGGDQRPPNA